MPESASLIFSLMFFYRLIFLKLIILGYLFQRSRVQEIQPLFCGASGRNGFRKAPVCPGLVAAICVAQNRVAQSQHLDVLIILFAAIRLKRTLKIICSGARRFPGHVAATRRQGHPEILRKMFGRCKRVLVVILRVELHRVPALVATIAHPAACGVFEQAQRRGFLAMQRAADPAFSGPPARNAQANPLGRIQRRNPTQQIENPVHAKPSTILIQYKTQKSKLFFRIAPKG
nr:MAG TPA: hypothetical protein [Caudoviricetes sp.]